MEISAFLIVTGNSSGDRLKALRQFIFQQDNVVCSQSITLQSCCLVLSVKKDQRANRKESNKAQWEAACTSLLSHSSPPWTQRVPALTQRRSQYCQATLFLLAAVLCTHLLRAPHSAAQQHCWATPAQQGQRARTPGSSWEKKKKERAKESTCLYELWSASIPFSLLFCCHLSLKLNNIWSCCHVNQETPQTQKVNLSPPCWILAPGTLDGKALGIRGSELGIHSWTCKCLMPTQLTKEILQRG